MTGSVAGCGPSGMRGNMGKKRHVLRNVLALLLAAACMLVTACGSSGQKGTGTSSRAGAQVIGSGGETLRILSGSENKELEPLLEECAKKNHVTLEMYYKGSLDIMHILETDSSSYDAVWPANSLWLNIGDKKHVVKHTESISVTPVVLGMKKSLAESLGFTDREVSVQDILDAVTDGKFTFCMTSATQSNSGASAYIGFLYALLGNPDMITEESLDDSELQKELTALFSGVERSSGSSDWLKDMFLKGNYDAMFNYECLVLDANEQLTKEGKEPLYIIYPYDGLSIADSPLGYIDNGHSDKETAFLKVQKYLLSDDAQDAIQKTGRRTGYSGVSEENKSIFKEEWGAQPDRVLSPFRMPDENTLMKCLDLYQTSLRKPSFNVYCIDYSGSMRGEGHDQMTAALEQLFIQKNAEENLLQAAANEVNIVIPFNANVLEELQSTGPEKLENIYYALSDLSPGGGTNMYAALMQGLAVMEQETDLDQYSPAFILLTDGESETDDKDKFLTMYDKYGKVIPIFSIMYGDADSSQLKELADHTNARVFDGRDDLTGAFRSVRGYS